MALPTDELRRLIARRSVDWTQLPGEKGHLLALQVDFEQPLPRQTQERLLREGQQATHAPVEGALSPRWVEVSPERVTLYLDPVHSGALRLDQVLSAVPPGVLGPALAGTIVATIAHVLHSLHLAPGVDGEARVHGELHAGTVLLTPVGSVALLGSGLPLLHALLLPERVREADRYRGLAPEAARGEPLDAGADLYSLGALYYQLLTGKPYRAEDSATTICTKAIENAPADLPGALANVRASLSPLLAPALTPERKRRYSSALSFAGALGAEMQGAGLGYSSAAAVAALVGSVPSVGLSTGPAALIAPEALSKDALGPRPSERPRATAIVEDLAVAPTSSPRAKPLASETSNDAWAAVLGGPGTAPQKTERDAAPADAQPARASADEAPAAVPLTLPKPRGGEPAPLAGPKIAPAINELVETAVGPKSSARQRPLKGSEPRSLASYAGYGIVAIVLLGTGVVWMVGKSNKGSSAPPPIAELAPDAGAQALIPPPAPPPPAGEEATEGALAEDTPDAGASRSRRGRRFIRPTADVPLPDAPPPPPPGTPVNLANRPANNGKSSALGLLSVNSKPSGASVELDGGYVGKTPLVMKAEFQPRSYTVTVMAEGHLRWSRSVVPDPQLKTITVMAVLEKDKPEPRGRKR